MDRIRPTDNLLFGHSQPRLYRNYHSFVCHVSRGDDHVLVGYPIGSQHRLDNIQLFEWRLFVGVLAILTGGIWVWYVYSYLFLAGGGSPGTHVDGGPVRLVDTGPYATIRHPLF